MPAVENKTHPAKWTMQNIESMKEQIKSIGFAYDWDREISTCDPIYYKHEQKMFLEFLKAGLAYQKESTVNWDPVDQTVLANEQVVDGKGWRSGVPIERKKLKQWFLKTTEFAEELLQELKNLKDWPEKVRNMQENWIGKSQGAKIKFKVEGSDRQIEIYTTRPDTIFGASFIAVATDHPFAQQIKEGREDIENFIQECSKLGTSQEEMESAPKRGIHTNFYALHPFDESIKIPIYIANFVLMEYGTGAIFGCPAHDARDHEFALKYQLPIRQVIKNTSDDINIMKEPYLDDGVIINSKFLDGMTVEEAKTNVISRLEDMGIGAGTIQYRLRDWGISRQRYWGCPIPIIHCKGCGAVPVPESQLPVELPDDIKFDKPGNPLDHHPTWKNTTCPKCNGKAVRETDTFDTFFESSWYFFRYCSPDSEQGIDSKKAEYWMPVDDYIGGIEHAVMHLLYARFFSKALEKCDYFNGLKEPFKALLTQGMINHETYKDKSGKWLYPTEVAFDKSKGVRNAVHIANNEPVTVGRVEKMSKSKKNVVEPNSIIAKYGADTARLFLMSDSPPDKDLEWSDSGVEGAYKYLCRLYNMVLELIEDKSKDAEVYDKDDSAVKFIHKTIQKVTDDYENFRINKAIANIRELTNFITQSGISPEVKHQGLETSVQLINPITPHIAEELWNILGHEENLTETNWLHYDQNLLVDDLVTVAVQLNGKMRGTVEISPDASEDDAKSAAENLPNIIKLIEGKSLRKIIYLPGKIINLIYINN